jgi:hypothetical protein
MLLGAARVYPVQVGKRRTCYEILFAFVYLLCSVRSMPFNDRFLNVTDKILVLNWRIFKA